MAVDYGMVGRQIRQRRRGRRMTQEALAELAELSVSYISCVERAKKQVSLEALVRIAAALDTTVDRLLLGNQREHFTALSNQWGELLSGCSRDETVHLYETALALKNSLHRTLRDSG